MSAKLTEFNNPLYQGQDPFMVKKDGYYIFVSSSNDDTNVGIYVSKSKTLIEQGERIQVFDSHGTQKRIFAPEIFFVDGKWYIYYCADYESEGWRHMAGCLESVTDDPQGEYIDHGVLYTGENGVNYMANDFTTVFWGGCQYAIWGTMDGPECPAIAPMDNPHTITADRRRFPECRGEGPRALTDGKTLYITVSQGPFANVDYHMGAYIYDGHGDILDEGSWSYEDNWFNHTDDVYGPARSSFVKSADGKEDYMVYHSKVYKANDNGWREVNVQRFTWENGKPKLGRPVSPFEFMPLPSGDPGIGEVYFASDACPERLENEHRGFAGQGYVNVSAKTCNELEFDVTAEQDGDYFIRIRYAYGVKVEGEYGERATQAPRKGQLCLGINGDYSRTVLFDKTDITWESWMYAGVRARLKKGDNKISLKVADPARADININYIAVDAF